MSNDRFVDDLIQAHGELQRRCARQESIIEVLARKVADDRGCPFPNERRCPASDGAECWHCWVMRAEDEAECQNGGAYYG